MASSSNNYWEYQYVPEIATPGIPREQQESAYKSWVARKDQQEMSSLLKTFGRLINSEINRYQGTLSKPLLHSFAKKYVADAVRSYDPSTGNQLSTHIVNNLQRLHRLNYRNVQGLRAPENVQGSINKLTEAKIELEDSLGREPSEVEIAEKMGVPSSFLESMRKNVKFEQGPIDMNLGTLQYESSKEDDISDLVYHDLPATQKEIFKYRTGYGGTPVISSKDIAEKLKMSPVRVSQISDEISKKIRSQLSYK